MYRTSQNLSSRDAPSPFKVGQVNLYALCVVVQKLGEHPAQQAKGCVAIGSTINNTRSRGVTRAHKGIPAEQSGTLAVGRTLKKKQGPPNLAATGRIPTGVLRLKGPSHLLG